MYYGWSCHLVCNLWLEYEACPVFPVSFMRLNGIHAHRTPAWFQICRARMVPDPEYSDPIRSLFSLSACLFLGPSSRLQPNIVHITWAQDQFFPLYVYVRMAVCVVSTCILHTSKYRSWQSKLHELNWIMEYHSELASSPTINYIFCAHIC